MALGIAISEGTRKLVALGRVVSGAAPNFTSLSFRPTLQAYTSKAVLRIQDAAGNVFDIELTWTALPRLQTEETQIEETA